MQPLRGGCFQVRNLPCGAHDDLTRPGLCRRSTGLEESSGLAGYRLTGRDERDVRACQVTQMHLQKGVVRAAQNQRINLAWLGAKWPDSPRVLCAECYQLRSIIRMDVLLDGLGQTVAGLADEFGQRAQ